MPPRFLPSFASGIRALPAHLALWLIGGLVSLPILALVVAVLQWDAQSAALLREMAGSVLGGYAFTTVVLSVVVSLGVAVVGTACACAVTLFDFRGRKQWEWALLLPLAMPAYVVAYAYTDYLQFSGPAQTWLRSAFGLEGRVLPEVRSLGGAALVFVCTLYPYVYLLVRVALLERAAHLMDAARLMGASLGRRVATIAVPLARPSIMAGVALALMETLADYGVSSYFGIQTFTAGIYKAWLVLDSRIAAAQLATALLILMALLLRLELHARQRMRYASVKGRRAVGWRGAGTRDPADGAGGLNAPVPTRRQWLMNLARPRQPETLPQRLDRRRIYVLPTRFGLFVACLLVAMLLGALNYNNNPALLLALLLATVAIASTISAHLQLSGLQIDAVSAEPVVADTALQMPVMAENRATAETTPTTIQPAVSSPP